MSPQPNGRRRLGTAAFSPLREGTCLGLPSLGSGLAATEKALELLTAKLKEVGLTQKTFPGRHQGTNLGQSVTVINDNGDF